MPRGLRIDLLKLVVQLFHGVSSSVNNVVDLFRRTAVVRVFQQMLPVYAFELIVEFICLPHGSYRECSNIGFRDGGGEDMTGQAERQEMKK